MSRRQLPRGTAAQLDAATFLPGEIAVDTTNDELRYDGDGSTVGGIALARKDGTNISVIATGSSTARTLADRFAETFNVADFDDDLQDAIDAASSAGGGLVEVDDDISIATTITLKSEVVINIRPGVTITWTGGSSAMFTSDSTNVLQDAGILGHGAIIAMGASATKCLELYGPYKCIFEGFRITGTLATSVVIDIRGDVTGGSNPIGNRNPVYCGFSDILHSGTCGRFIRLRGEGTDGVSATYPVVLNTFHNMHCEDARIIAIDFARWCDNNYFSGYTRVAINGNNSVGVSYNSENPTVNCGVYANNFDDLAVDTFSTYTGRVGVAMDNTKQNVINSYYQYPVAEGGSLTTTANTGSYWIRYDNESQAKTQLLTKSFEKAGTDSSNPINNDVHNYDTGTSVAQHRAISGAATGATAILSAQAGISYIGNSSNHPTGIISNNTERMRFETNGNIVVKTSGAVIVGNADDALTFGSTALGISDIFLASGAVLNWNNGNFTVTHSAGSLAFAGGQVSFATTASGTGAVKSINTADAASVQALRIEGDRATPAANDTIYQSWYLSDASGNQDEFARFAMIGQVVTNGAEQARMDLALMSAGALTTFYNFTTSAFRPNANDLAALGSATVSWADLFLASGGVINWANGNVTLTHASGKVTLGGGDLVLSSGFRIDLQNSQSTVGAAGGASALPATPSGYIPIKVGGVEFVVPYYAKT